MLPCKRKIPARILILLLLTTLITAACRRPIGNPRPVESPTVQVLTSSPSVDWLQVYFTDPANPMAKKHVAGPDEALAAAIHLARLSVDMAVYSLNLWNIRDAL